MHGHHHHSLRTCYANKTLYVNINERRHQDLAVESVHNSTMTGYHGTKILQHGLVLNTFARDLFATQSAAKQVLVGVGGGTPHSVNPLSPIQTFGQSKRLCDWDSTLWWYKSKNYTCHNFVRHNSSSWRSIPRTGWRLSDSVPGLSSRFARTNFAGDCKTRPATTQDCPQKKTMTYREPSKLRWFDLYVQNREVGLVYPLKIEQKNP